MEYVIMFAILMLALVDGALWWYANKRLEATAKSIISGVWNRTATDFNDLQRDLRDGLEALRPKVEVWGVSFRAQAQDYSEVATGSDFLKAARVREYPMGNYLVLAPGEDTAEITLRPQYPVRIQEVRVFGGPWLLNRVRIGNKVVSYCEGLNTGIGDSTQTIVIDEIVHPGNEISVRLDRPRGMP
jgi:hypothetical protein